jgi:hypothetical protein
MSKKIIAPPKPQRADLPANVDDWISRPEDSQAAPTTNGRQLADEPTVRLTFDISESLHRRIKIGCTKQGIKRVAVEIRRILEERFPEE